MLFAFYLFYQIYNIDLHNFELTRQRNTFETICIDNKNIFNIDFYEKDENLFLVLIKKDSVETKKITNELKSTSEMDNDNT